MRAFFTSFLTEVFTVTILAALIYLVMRLEYLTR